MVVAAGMMTTVPGKSPKFYLLVLKTTMNCISGSIKFMDQSQ